MVDKIYGYDAEIVEKAQKRMLLYLGEGIDAKLNED